MVFIQEVSPNEPAEVQVLLLSKPVDVERLSVYIQNNALSPDDTGVLISKLEAWLALDVRDEHYHTSKLPYLSLAVTLFRKSTQENLLRLLCLIGAYINPHVKWSNLELANIASSLSVDEISVHMSQFFDFLKPRFLSMRNSKVTLAGYKRDESPIPRGLRPKLGLLSSYEQNTRDTWKRSDDVKALSWVVLLMKVGRRWSGFDHSWPVITTFIINVLDDSDAYYREQGCHLLNIFLSCELGDLLLKSGMVHVFQEALETSLNFLPSLTPAEKSLSLLSATYPTLYSLQHLKKASPMEFVGILDKHILGLISHVQGRHNDAKSNSVLRFLLSQIAIIVTDYIGPSVLGCLSRLIFVLNQLIVNPFVIDTEDGVGVVNAALEAHCAILQVFAKLNNKEGSNLVMLYRYDFIGPWVILCKRVSRFNVGDSQTQALLEKNVALLGDISKSAALGDSLKEDLQQTCLKVAEFKSYVH